MTLQQHFNLIKEGKGNKDQFLKQARSLFPQYFNQYTDFNTATNVLKSKQIISEAAGGVVSKGYSAYDWKKILGEEVKAMEKETSKEVLDYRKNAYDNVDMKNADNVNFNEIMKGFFAEMYEAKNQGKTGDEIKAMVVKNLAKDPLYYTKNGNFSTMGVGYTEEAPGLGQPKEPKGKFKSSGYGDIEKEVKVKANVKDSLGDSEAKDSMPKKVKEMPDKGVSGVEKRIKLKENTNEVVYQGPSVGGPSMPGEKGRRFIPNVTVLSREAVDAINDRGRTRVNWNKPHIKIVKSGENIKLQVSQPLLDVISGSQRGNFAGSSLQSKMGTGLTSEDTKMLSGEFKKLLRTLNAASKLSKTGDYYLVDVDTVYNPKRDQFELPLPKAIQEISDIDLSQYNSMSDREIIRWAKDDGMEDMIVMDPEGGLVNREELLLALLGTEGMGDEEKMDDLGDEKVMMAEQKLRSVIAKLIKEELNEGSIKFVPGRVYASKNGKLTYIGVIPPGGSHKGQKNPTQENLYLFADENGKKGFGFTMEQLKQAKMDPMSTKGDFGNLPDGNIVSADGLGSLLDMIKNATVNKTLSASELGESKLRSVIAKLIKEELNEDESDLDARLKKYVENEVSTGDWKSIKNYYKEMTQDKPDPERRYFELVDGILKKYGY